MSLLNNRALISHLVVIILLHDIQLSASVRDPKFGLERFPRIFTMLKSHVRVNNIVPKNAEQYLLIHGVDLLKSFLLIRRNFPLRSSIDGAIALEVLKPQNCSCAPTNIMHTIKGRRLSSSSNAASIDLPIIRFLDC